MIKNKRSLDEAKAIFYDKENSLINKIGEYQEKAIHLILKNYFETDEDKMEVKIGSFYADIYNEFGIIEIQTRSFERLCKKLDYFLKDYQVYIVYPIIENKLITWINSNNVSDYNRKSPSHKNIYSSFKELYKIKKYLKNPNLHFDFIFLNAVELKNLDGYDQTKKKHATSFNKIPISINKEIKIESYLDFSFLIEDIDKEFTVKSIASNKKVSKDDVRICLNVLSYLGLIKRIDDGKREHVYIKNN